MNKFNYCDRVEVIKGFYKGLRGKVIRLYGSNNIFWFESYKYSYELLLENSQGFPYATIDEEELSPMKDSINTLEITK